MAAKYYLYRNLHTGGFSIKHRGKVCSRCNIFTMKDVEFRVSKKGQHQVQKNNQKNVHAYIVADNYQHASISPIALDKLIIADGTMKEITYNPYGESTFYIKETNEPINNADYVICVNGKVYIK